MRHGRAIGAVLGSDGEVAVFDTDGAFLALYRHEGPLAKATAVRGQPSSTSSRSLKSESASDL